MATWVVRGGKAGVYERDCLNEDRVYLNWEIECDLATIPSRGDMKQIFYRQYPQWPEAVPGWTGHHWRFVHDMREGDVVVMPHKGKPHVSVGKIAGEYAYLPNHSVYKRHSRPVNWIASYAERNSFDPDLKNAFKCRPTVYRIKLERADERIFTLVQ